MTSPTTALRRHVIWGVTYYECATADAALATLSREHAERLAERDRRIGELEAALAEALELRRSLCRHSDMLDEGGDPDKWDGPCKRWSAALSPPPAVKHPAVTPPSEEGDV